VVGGLGVYLCMLFCSYSHIYVVVVIDDWISVLSSTVGDLFDEGDLLRIIGCEYKYL
jgi:hypothetical protein